MSNQIYSNTDLRQKYDEPKPELFVQQNNDRVLPTTPGYTNTLLEFNTNSLTNTGYLSYDTVEHMIVCESSGVFVVQATVSYYGVSASESVELYFLKNGGSIPEYGLVILPRSLTTIAGSESSVLTASYIFQGVPGTTIQTRIKSKDAITIQGVNNSPSKRTYLTCTKIN